MVRVALGRMTVVFPLDPDGFVPDWNNISILYQYYNYNFRYVFFRNIDQETDFIVVTGFEQIIGIIIQYFFVSVRIF